MHAYGSNLLQFSPCMWKGFPYKKVPVIRYFVDRLVNKKHVHLPGVVRRALNAVSDKNKRET